MNKYNFQVNNKLAIMAFSITDFLSADRLDAWIETFGLHAIIVHHESDVYFPKHTIILIQPTSKDLMDLFRILIHKTPTGKSIPANELVIFSAYENFANALLNGKIKIININKTPLYKKDEQKDFVLQAFYEYHKENYPSLINTYELSDNQNKRILIKRKAHIFN
jgi:hypothetical protein